MPGFEIFGDEERKEVQDVLDSGVLFRYGFDQARNNHWKARDFEKELAEKNRVRLLPSLFQWNGGPFRCVGCLRRRGG